MKLKSPKQKGDAFEREVCAIINRALADHGVNCRRVPCSGALSDMKGDIRNLTGPLADWVIECKKQEKLNIWAAIQQAVRGAGSKMWLLVFSRNREPAIYVTMDLQDWLALIDERWSWRKERGDK